MNTTKSQEVPNNRRAWMILLVLSLPLFIGSLDLTIISAILPEVMTQLNLPPQTNFDEASWAIGGYLLGYTISMTFTGRLSDILGRRKLYIICMGIFMFGSWFVTIAHKWPADQYLEVYRFIYPNPDTHTPPVANIRQLNMIIAGRIIQALGAGSMVPVTMAIVSDMFPANRRARPLGVVGAIDTSGWVLGHLYGGVMVKFFGTNGQDIVDFFANLGIQVDYPDWRALFLVNIPLTMISVMAAWLAVRGPQFAPRRDIRFDLIGATLITVALIGLNIGLGGVSPESATAASDFEELGQQANADLTAPLLIVAAIAFLAFIGWERYTKTPLIDLNLFRRWNYSVGAFNNFCAGFSLAIGLVSIPLIINIRAEAATTEAIQTAALRTGLVLSGLTVPMSLAAIPGGWLSDRFGYRVVTGAGMLIAVLGFLFCSLTWQSDTSFTMMAAQVAIIGVGLGITFSPISTGVINEAGDNDRGVAASLVLIMRLVGMSVAVSALTTFALYRVEQRADDMQIADTELARNDALFEATVSQVNELFLIGAVVTGLAFFASLKMQGGKTFQREASPIPSVVKYVHPKESDFVSADYTLQHPQSTSS